MKDSVDDRGEVRMLDGIVYGLIVWWTCGRRISWFDPFEGLKPTLVMIYIVADWLGKFYVSIMQNIYKK